VFRWVSPVIRSPYNLANGKSDTLAEVFRKTISFAARHPLSRRLSSTIPLGVRPGWRRFGGTGSGAFGIRPGGGLWVGTGCAFARPAVWRALWCDDAQIESESGSRQIWKWMGASCGVRRASAGVVRWQDCHLTAVADFATHTVRHRGRRPPR